MPKLKAYTEGSEKSGHYILANVGGSHPVTLQVSDLGEQILENTGYKSGSNVPTKLVWMMFDIGILYTSGNISDIDKKFENPEEIFQQFDLANKLTAEELDRLLRYLSEYTGPNQTEIEALRKSIEESVGQINSRTSLPEEVQNDVDRISDLFERGELTSEEFGLLKSRILDSYSPTETSRDVPETKVDKSSWEEEVRFDIHQEMLGLIPEDQYSPRKTLEITDVHDNPLIWEVSFDTGEFGFTYRCWLNSRRQEELMFRILDRNQWELLENHTDWNTPYVIITREATGGGFQSDFSKQDINDEISNLLRLIQNVYHTKLSNLVSGNEDLGYRLIFD